MRLLVISFLVLSSSSIATIDTKDCFNLSASVLVSHKSGLMGIMSHNLKIQKKECEIEVEHKTIMTRKWIVDICREPIHIKYNSTGGINVYKKSSPCLTANTDNFCSSYNDLITLIQDEGLVFAEGLRSSLDSDHGKVYCIFKLLSKYLEKDFIFGGPKEIDLFSDVTGDHCDLVSQPKSQLTPTPTIKTEDDIELEDASTPPEATREKKHFINPIEKKSGAF